MNRDDLDAFFAKADDVLTDWHGSPDSMSTDEPPPYEWGTAAWSRGTSMGSVGVFQMSAPIGMRDALDDALRRYRTAAVQDILAQSRLYRPINWASLLGGAS